MCAFFSTHSLLTAASPKPKAKEDPKMSYDMIDTKTQQKRNKPFNLTRKCYCAHVVPSRYLGIL